MTDVECSDYTDHCTIENDVLDRINAKLGKFGPALYVIAFNAKGDGMLVSAPELKVRHFNTWEFGYVALGECTVRKLDSISLMVTEKHHLLQQTATASKEEAGIPNCNLHLIRMS